MRLRFALLVVLSLVGFVALSTRLADLQLRNFEVYGQAAEKSRTKKFTLKGARGQIQDANGAVLAYDKKIYDIQFYREPSTDRSGYASSIWEVIRMVEQSGKKTISDFWLRLDEADGWVFDVGLGIRMGADGIWKFNAEPKPDANGLIPTEPSADTVKTANSRVNMLRSNFYATATKYPTPADLFEYLCSAYGVNALNESLPNEEKLSIEDKRKILAVWQEMQMNAFSSRPVTIATDVPWSTVLEVEMRSITLSGISVAVSSQRVYPQGTLACHILGYVGPIPAGLWSTGSAEYLRKGYAMNDWVGLDGIERTMEDWLTGNTTARQGSKVVEVDYQGRIMRELSQTAAQDGNTVKLTIRSDLQRVAETALAEVVNDIRDAQEALIKTDRWLEQNKAALEARNFTAYPLQLAQNGALVVLDMQARVLAMASVPDFDPNLFILGMDDAQRERTLNDPRHPLFNNAIGSRDTPGSIFKMATALAGLTAAPVLPDVRSAQELDSNDKLYKSAADSVGETFTINTRISDRSPFRFFDTVNPPSCWANAATRVEKHSNQTIVEGLANSCNYFFFNVASALGADGEALYSYAAKMGLTSKTNIELPGEIRSIVGNQRSLYDPSRALTEADQDTAVPKLVKNSLKDHLKRVGEKYSYTYADDRLDRCVKALMDMAVNTAQTEWVSSIRVILMRELGMPRDIVILAATVNDIYRLLNDIKWGGSQSILTAIGQSITLLTPIAVARYVAAVANGGIVYDVSLIDSILSPTGEVLNPMDHPVVINDLSEEIAPYLPSIWQGMHDVVADGTAVSAFKGWKYLDQIAGKTGTAEKSKLDVENNAWFVAFAPYDKPEIAVVVYVPNGMSAGSTIPAAKAVIETYMESRQEIAPAPIPSPNTLAP
jgi:penicillin-binding protein 2